MRYHRSLAIGHTYAQSQRSSGADEGFSDGTQEIVPEDEEEFDSAPSGSAVTHAMDVTESDSEEDDAYDVLVGLEHDETGESGESGDEESLVMEEMYSYL